MVRVESYYIALDNPLSIYYPGQTISGKVVVKTDEELSLEAILLEIEGKASVRWTEKRPIGGRISQRKFDKIIRMDRHSYFKFELTLLQAPDAEESTTLAAGKYEYPFSQVLPCDLPSSFEGSYGQIRYTCSSHISIPWRFDPKCKVAFTVLESIDLNTLPGIEKPCSAQNTKTLGMCCLQSGNVAASVSIDKQGYVPGENISISAEIENSTDGEISDTTATLICMITYRSGTHTKLEKKDICYVKKGIIQPRSTYHWENQCLLIPSVPPTRVGAALCRLINLEYYLQFSVDPSGLVARDLEFTIPVTIGSIPLVKDFSKFTSSPQRSFPELELREQHLPGSVNYPNLPSNSYKECYSGEVNIKEDDDDEHTMGSLSYVPRYLCYFQQPAQLQELHDTN